MNRHVAGVRKEKVIFIHLIRLYAVYWGGFYELLGSVVFGYCASGKLLVSCQVTMVELGIWVLDRALAIHFDMINLQLFRWFCDRKHDDRLNELEQAAALVFERFVFRRW